ncbi:hypothetical protein CICLE_v10023289mg [Citrus x clementina]|uniref:Uncharacterized protein n=1 Tax=Citrus clementina TaxID=85681 RepID=V4TCI0_CITCL|nr:hypothetical protein CICLE_v10023289mg [Citrus x clementina]
MCALRILSSLLQTHDTPPPRHLTSLHDSQLHLGVATWIKIRFFDLIRCELNEFGFEKIDSFNNRQVLRFATAPNPWICVSVIAHEAQLTFLDIQLLPEIDSDFSQSNSQSTKPVTKINFGHFPVSFSKSSHFERSLQDTYFSSTHFQPIHADNSIQYLGADIIVWIIIFF